MITMSLVPAKCENCGSVLQVDDLQRAAICPYCGTAYVIQDAITYYQSFTENIPVEDRIHAGEVFLKLEKYDEALDAFKQALDIAPDDYRTWWGCVKALSHNFTLQIESSQRLMQIADYYETALKIADEEKRTRLKERFEPYFDPLMKKLQNEVEELRKKTAYIISENDRLKRKESQLMRSIDEERRGKETIGTIKNGFIIVCSTLFVIGLLLFFNSKEAGIYFIGFTPILGIIGFIICKNHINSNISSKVGALSNELSETRIKIAQLEQQKRMLEEKLVTLQSEDKMMAD